VNGVGLMPKHERCISSTNAHIHSLSIHVRCSLTTAIDISYEMSFYRQTITPLVKYLKTLSVLLDKGVKFADARGMQYEEILNYKLAPDMKP
jgi:hypothetical protein